MDDDKDEEGANIVFFASNEPFVFNVPTHGDYKDAIKNTFFYVRTCTKRHHVFTPLTCAHLSSRKQVVANFPKWEVSNISSCVSSLSPDSTDTCI